MSGILFVMRSPFAASLRRRREQLTMSRADLARHVNRSEAWVSLIEGGQRTPDLDIVPDIARVLGLDPRGLVTAFVHQFHPPAARVLFDHPSPEVEDREPTTLNTEIARLLAGLPDDLRAQIEDLVRSLHAHFSASRPTDYQNDVDN